MSDNKEQSPIGIFDSGYGGLAVMRSIVEKLPRYDYIYLGDNARTPYGNRSFETVYHFTLECVQHLFDMGCRLVVLACNTASAKALKTIQQQDLPKMDTLRRVLGVIRPTTEMVGNVTQSKEVGICATAGTVASGSYEIEIKKFFPDVRVYQQACPMWVPLVENGEAESPGADYFIQKEINKLLAQSPKIDTIVLGCTHYPLLLPKIRQFSPKQITLLPQGKIVADSLADYLKRHPEMEALCSKNGDRNFFTTDSPELFDQRACIFYGSRTNAQQLVL